MTCELPCVSYMALYIISMHIVNSNSRASSNHWKLNMSAGKVEPSKDQVDQEDEKVMSILTSNRVVKNGQWTVDGGEEDEGFCDSKSCTSSNNDKKSKESQNILPRKRFVCKRRTIIIYC